jgi:serine protease Do
MGTIRAPGLPYSPLHQQEIGMFKKSAVVLAVTAVTAIGSLAYWQGDFDSIKQSHAVTTAPVAIQTGKSLPDFSALVDQAGGAVVNISVVQKAQPAGPAAGIDPSDPFYEFFRRFQGQGQGQAPNEAPRQGVGSGFIVSADGLILTNAHVVADASEVTVKLTDKREFKAKVLGVDRRTDVALIKIDASGLPTVRIGNSSQVRVGEWVAAIGSPFGFENSVTAGIVSAKARVLPDENYVPFLQTDVAINPGNSGGPLFNMSGEVVGINSQIYSRTGGYMGLSFAIPIEVAMKVKDDLQKFGKVSRGRLGVNIQPLTKELADSFGLKSVQGALVSAVEPNSAAAKAGIEPGDVVISVNDKAIEQPADLVRAVGDTHPGASVSLKVWRQGASRDLVARLGETAAEKTAAAEEPAQATPKLGLSVRPLSSDEKQQLGGRGGLVVENVAGPAAAAGIVPGDVILAVNNQPVSSVGDLRRLLPQGKGSVAMLVQRENQRIYIPVRIG